MGTRLEINGSAAEAALARLLPAAGYGHFTAMQVRNGRVRGLELHLRRLSGATKELFGAGLDEAMVRGHLRHALRDETDASARIHMFQPNGDGRPSIVVTVRPPDEMPAAAQRLQVVGYQRPAAHLKHTGTFGQHYYGERAERDGYDDALLTGPDGLICESTIANIAFFDGNAVVWPQAPMLRGITMQLLEPRLVEAGLDARRVPVRLADLGAFPSAFVLNSIGIAPVGGINGVRLAVDPRLMATVTEAYESVPWDPI
jgi:branched-subunit amino acid aminotransferase/4-amino-4-deoxychorismate lyase